MPEEEPRIERAMVVHAHPDDMEFGCGGTVAKLAAGGAEVTLVVCTAGNRGGEGERSEEELARVREEEQAAAARVLGIKHVVNLGYDDGSLTPSLELRKDITRQIRKYRPNLVFSANPVRNFLPIYGNHPDHLAAGEATLAAVYPTARNPMAFPELMRDEGLDKWVVDWVYVTGAVGEPDHYEDITAYIEKKVEALLCHKSQLEPEVANFVKYRDTERAKKAKELGLGDFEYAEAFRQMFVGEIRRPEDVLRLAQEERAGEAAPATPG
jgi:LmbE family N-acetylglucosaminyl deacetylase